MAARKKSANSAISRTIGNAAWVERRATANSIRALGRHLRDGSTLDRSDAERVLEGLARWERAGGKLTLDAALGLTRRGWPHPLEELGLMERNSAYLIELAQLLGLGFAPKEADHAIARRFRLAPPWKEKFPRIRPLSQESVSSLRKQHLRAGYCLAEEGGGMMRWPTVEEVKQRAASWSESERAKYLGLFPKGSLPGRLTK